MPRAPGTKERKAVLLLESATLMPFKKSSILVIGFGLKIEKEITIF